MALFYSTTLINTVNGNCPEESPSLSPSPFPSSNINDSTGQYLIYYSFAISPFLIQVVLYLIHVRIGMIWVSERAATILFILMEPLLIKWHCDWFQQPEIERRERERETSLATKFYNSLTKVNSFIGKCSRKFSSLSANSISICPLSWIHWRLSSGVTTSLCSCGLQQNHSQSPVYQCTK